MASGANVHNTLEQVNNMLAVRTITSVEPGRTSGWILLNFAPIPDDNGCRAFMTIEVEEESDPYYWSAAVHYRDPEGRAIKYPIRPFVESK
jgi:hypothetical protein